MERREEAEKKIVDYDPLFAKLLEKRDLIQNEISDIGALYRKAANAIYIQIESLKKKREDLRVEYLQALEAKKQQLVPDQQELRNKLIDISARFKIKTNEMNDVKRDISEVDNLMQKKNRLDFTKEEIQVWNKKHSILLEREATLGQELTKLGEEIGMLRLKIKVLKAR
ncbi:MAG: hypothetical protein HQL30_04380 [Candidatus Omnitrophica bacterium]|nr:hypothetical protein [Candidatus Omnitrophota bacterium]